MNTISNYIESVDNAFLFIVVISVIILVGVTVAMIYFVIRYSRKRNPKASNIEGNLLLEVTWIAIPTILVLAMFYYGFITFKVLRQLPENAMVVKVTGQMWKWSFVYDNGKRYDTLYVPLGVPVKLEMQSVDVNHSFYIPAFRIKEDVIPSRQTYLAFTADKIGSFDVACAEYCGMKHSYMYNKVHVIPKEKFYAWVQDTTQKQNEVTPKQKPGDMSNNLLTQKGCIACHSTDGSKMVGPSLKHAKPGSKVVVVRDGKELELTIDEEYLRRSILKPNEEIVKGYFPGMPPQFVSEDELKQLVEIIKKI